MKTRIKYISIRATTGEKSNIPVLGNILLIGNKTGSVIAKTTLITVKNGLPGPTLNHDNNTLARIAKYKIFSKILRKFPIKENISYYLILLTFHKLTEQH